MSPTRENASSSFSIARVVDISSQDGQTRVVLLAGDTPHDVVWPVATPPALGDLYAVGSFAPLRLMDRLGGPAANGWRTDGDALRWRGPGEAGLSRMEVLHRRAIIRRAVRAYMDGQGFLEIDIPLLVHGVIPDAALHSFAIDDRFLVTTTENQLKRMETGGFDKIYSLTKNFREGDTTSPYRNPEFTMLEWARVGEPYEAVEADVENLTWAAHKALGGTGVIAYAGHNIDLTPPWDRLTVRDAIQKYVGTPMPDFSIPNLLHALDAAKIALRDDWKTDQSFLATLLLDHLQQFLGFEKPVFLEDWPAFQTSMGLEKENGTIAIRSEVYVAGIELADGFPALTDYDRQRETFQRQIDLRRDQGLPLPVVDTHYLEALREGLPAESSIALGFDRLVMLLTGQTHIKSTLAFAWDEL